MHLSPSQGSRGDMYSIGIDKTLVFFVTIL